MPELKDAEPVYETAPARSIELNHSLNIRRMNQGKPVLTPKAGSSWESKVVLNPGVVFVDDLGLLEPMMKSWEIAEDQKEKLRKAGGASIMLYRAQGEIDAEKGLAPSYTGLAVFTPNLELVWRRSQPVISPIESFHNLGVEDGRCSYIEGKFYFLYTGYFSDEQSDTNKVHICLASTTDFINWDLKGPLPGNLNNVDNKNSVLFPEKIHGKYVMLHRPMQGQNPKSIHWAVADSIDGYWESRGFLMASYKYKEFRQSWIGAGGPPIILDKNRFLVIYHQGHFFPNNEREYDLAATILEFPEPGECNVQKRIEPLMRPTGAEEQQGDKNLGVDNVLFTCANYVWYEDLIIPYAGADSRIFGAKVNLEELVNELEN
ncbi:MAG: hypothetical protein WD361_08395 [Gracilimonas sp.]